MRACTVGVMLQDERKAQPPAGYHRRRHGPRKEKIIHPADFFFVIPMNDQCSRHQHRRPAFATDRKDPATAQASPRDGT